MNAPLFGFVYNSFDAFLGSLEARLSRLLLECGLRVLGDEFFLLLAWGTANIDASSDHLFDGAYQR